MEESENDFFADSRKKLEQYVRDRIWLVQLQASEKAARLIAILFSLFLTGLLVFFIIVFLSIMAGYYFAGITGSLYAGFGIVGAWYVLLLVILILVRKWFEKKIINIVIRIFFAKIDEYDEKPQ